MLAKIACRKLIFMVLVCGFAMGADIGSAAAASRAAQATKDLDPATAGMVRGPGIESQDIISMTDKMMRDMLQNPQIANAQRPPQVIVDEQYFINESSQRLNKALITDRLRVGLTRAANGRMTFVTRSYGSMVEDERERKRTGQGDEGTTGLAAKTASADYRLAGRISSLDSRDNSTGASQRYNQIVFEMVDLERGTIVWNGIYEFARGAVDDVTNQ